MKKILKNIIPFKWFYDFLLKSHLLSKSTRAIVILNFIVQRIFGYNRKLTWSIHFTSNVSVPEKIKIHESVKRSFMISGGCYYQAANGIIIGANTIWAPGVSMISANHDKDNLQRWKEGKPIIIGERCWIGANAIILPEVELGDDCIIGAGSVVTKSFAGKSVIAGNPAKIIKYR